MTPASDPLSLSTFQRSSSMRLATSIHTTLSPSVLEVFFPSTAQGINQSINPPPPFQPTFSTAPGAYHLQLQQTSAKQTAYSNAIIRQRTLPTICTGSDLSTCLCNSTVDTLSPFPDFPFVPFSSLPLPDWQYLHPIHLTAARVHCPPSTLHSTPLTRHP